MSLMMVTLAVADMVGSAALVAVTGTLAGDGKSAGAVYRPADVMVPAAVLPLETPFTLQVTAKLEVPMTVAINALVLPRMTEPVCGVTLTSSSGGGGATIPVAPPPQPAKTAPSAEVKHLFLPRNGEATGADCVDVDSVKVACSRQKQAKGQRSAGAGDCSLGKVPRYNKVSIIFR